MFEGNARIVQEIHLLGEASPRKENPSVINVPRVGALLCGSGVRGSGASLINVDDSCNNTDKLTDR